jgi:hypothetical protein
MITCHKAHLEARCRERGYTLDEVRPCIVSQDGETITVDPDHPAYPKTPKPAPTGCLAGTELKALLKTIGIVASPTCSCNARAKVMDERGCQWVLDNEDEVVVWLRQEAQKRGLPFVDLAGRQLIRLAVKRARKKEAVHRAGAGT